jgi:hypothetical protein
MISSQLHKDIEAEQERILSLPRHAPHDFVTENFGVANWTNMVGYHNSEAARLADKPAQARPHLLAAAALTLMALREIDEGKP